MKSLRLFPLALVLALEAGTVTVLHRLGSVGGLDARTVVAVGAPPEDVLMAAARLVALALAWWLLTTTALCVLARACRLPAAARSVEWVTLPAVRRLVERSLAVTLSLSAVAVSLPAGGLARAAPVATARADPVTAVLAPELERGTVVPPGAGLPAPGPGTVDPPVAASPPGTGAPAASVTGRGTGVPAEGPVVPPVVFEGAVVLPAPAAGLVEPVPGAPRRGPSPAGGSGLPGAGPDVSGLPGAGPDVSGLPGAGPDVTGLSRDSAGAGTPPAESGRDAGLPRTHRVGPGEHLWGLAAAAVAEATGRVPATVPAAEVAAYWVRLVAANPANLRSGDPDLVYPGEVVLLPEVHG